jgi:hypothetical protein
MFFFLFERFFGHIVCLKARVNQPDIRGFLVLVKSDFILQPLPVKQGINKKCRTGMPVYQ